MFKRRNFNLWSRESTIAPMNQASFLANFFCLFFFNMCVINAAARH